MLASTFSVWFPPINASCNICHKDIHRGHGWRGLTAVEAAILMEQPLDKIMTMILFSILKKNAATVITRDPLKLEVVKPLPTDLQPYEVTFLQAFEKENTRDRRLELQNMTVGLVKSVSEKMKGFSSKETITYYETIINQAWQQVTAANTPEVKSETYEQVMEWTMLDKDWDGRPAKSWGRNRFLCLPGGGATIQSSARAAMAALEKSQRLPQFRSAICASDLYHAKIAGNQILPLR